MWKARAAVGLPRRVELGLPPGRTPESQGRAARAWVRPCKRPPRCGGPLPHTSAPPAAGKGPPGGPGGPSGGRGRAASRGDCAPPPEFNFNKRAQPALDLAASLTARLGPGLIEPGSPGNRFKGIKAVNHLQAPSQSGLANKEPPGPLQTRPRSASRWRGPGSAVSPAARPPSRADREAEAERGGRDPARHRLRGPGRAGGRGARALPRRLAAALQFEST